MNKHRFDDKERAAVYKAIAERRDMRHFLPDPIDPEIIRHLLQAAHQAGSVGLMQPWRFIRITDKQLRASIHQQVEQERIATAKALAEREDEFMKLKVEGILECAELMVVALQDHREQHIFGRRTLPEMDLASTAWVSLFDPQQLASLLHIPQGSQPIAILCLGHVAEFYPKPMLEMENWAQAKPLDEFISENAW